MTAATTTIYMKLLDEALEVWRPVAAVHLREEAYRILPQDYNPDVEKWEFEPGSVVICELVRGQDGEFLAAVRQV